VEDLKNDKVTIGKVVRPHGIKGELVIRPQAVEDEEIFTDNVTYYLCAGEFEEQVLVTNIRWHKGDVLLKIDGIEDRNAAEEYRNCAVKIPDESLPELPQYTYFIDDVVGCTVVDSAGNALGEVGGVLPTGAVAVLEIQSPEGGWMLPAAFKFIKDVDLQKKEIIVELIDGLRDLQC